MSVFNNRYYPESRSSTWSDISALTWADADQDWLTISANAANTSVAWSYVSTATDLGSRRSFYPETTVEWDDSQPVTITYLVSDDDVTYTTYTPQPLEGRYLKTQINTSGAWLSSITTTIQTEPRIETWYNLNSNTLPGNVTHRTLTTNNFSRITSVTVTAATTETRPVAGQLIANNTGNITLRVIDLDTWDKVAVDANVNIVVAGFPRLTSNSIQGIVYRSI
jgi:hypothetical protein